MAKTKKIIYWISTCWLALGMVSTAIVQLTKGKTGAGGTDSLSHLGYPVYILALLAIWKFLGVAAVLIPRFPLVKEWAYAGFFFLMSGAIYSHLAAGEPVKEVFPALLLLVLTLVSRASRPADRKFSTGN